MTLFGPASPSGNSATLSDCGAYRYVLTRWWDSRTPPVVFLMLNPSTADAVQDDPTIRRCIRFARDWGCGGLTVLNLFALRATDPKDLYWSLDPIGQHNDSTIATMARGRDVIAAWGTHGSYRGRDRQVMDLLSTLGCRVACLGTTKDGHPRHPLYVAAHTTPAPFRMGGAA